MQEEYMKNLQVLYVEDEAETRAQLGDFLKRRMGKVYLAANGNEGIDLYKQYQPDIIIADLLMPDMGGMEMIRRIREINDDCFIIITSTLGEVNSILDAVEVGICKYIIKPINVDKLLNELEKITEKIKKKRQNTSGIIDIAEKKKTEDEIKKKFISLLKQDAGKGPREVNVLINGQYVEITAFDTLTVMEKKLLDNPANSAIIEQNRQIFYSVIQEELLSLTSFSLGRSSRIHSIRIDAAGGFDKISLFVE